MPLDGRFITFSGNGLDERCGHHVGFSELRPDACMHRTEVRPLRLCMARPSQASQRNERATDTTMDGGHCPIRGDRPLVCPTPAVSGSGDEREPAIGSTMLLGSLPPRWPMSLPSGRNSDTDDQD